MVRKPEKTAGLSGKSEILFLQVEVSTGLPSSDFSGASAAVTAEVSSCARVLLPVVFLKLQNGGTEYLHAQETDLRECSSEQFDFRLKRPKESYTYPVKAKRLRLQRSTRRDEQ